MLEGAGALTLAAAEPAGAVILIELGAVLLGLALLGRAALRAGISPIPLYLLAGLAFGDGGLVPLEVSENFVEFGAELGVVLLLFTLGLEYTAEELRSSLKTSVPAGAVDLVLNFLPGFAVGLLLGWSPIAAVLLGGVTFVSSSGVIAKVLGDLKRFGNRETPTILSILVIEDLAMAVYLPIVAVLLAGGELVTGAVSLAAALVAVTVILVVALRYGDRISRVVFTHSDEVLLLSVLGLTLLVAGIAQRLQVSSAVGAFLVGIAISGNAAHQSRQLLVPLRDLFAAIFFLFFGLQTTPAELPAALPIAAALAVLTTATKMATGWWAGSRAGVGPRGRVRAGLTLSARGEFSIVIAGLGVAVGIEPELGPLAAAYVLIMASAGPLLARAANPVSRLLAGRWPRFAASGRPVTVVSEASGRRARVTPSAESGAEPGGGAGARRPDDPAPGARDPVPGESTPSDGGMHG